MRKIFSILLFLMASHATAQVVLNEICPANADIIYDPDYYNFSGWIELYNGSSSIANIGGYYLSDKIDQPLKWRIPNGTTVPAKGFLLIWCDDLNTGRHANFSLNSDGESVAFSNNAGILLDKITFPKQHTNVSYGRTTDGTGPWGFLAVPTPVSTNHGVAGSQQLDKPRYSKPGGRYAGQQEVILTKSNAQGEIRYTTDGSEPRHTSTLYNTPLIITKTSTIKAKVFATDMIPSATEIQTYFINEHTTALPIVSISTKPEYISDNRIGIYVRGSNGVTGNCENTAVNWNRDWDRHAVFEYFDKDGKRLFHQSVDISIAGGCSRSQAQKSLAIKARTKYGDNTMHYRFFESKSTHEFGGLLLRNSGNDFNMTMFRDALMQNLLVGQMDVDYQEYQPAILYLNGQYMGIQNLREKMDADYIDSNYGLNDDEIDLLEGDKYAKEGTNTAYTNYLAGLRGMNRTTPAAFAYIDANIDVQEYINYLVAQIYFGNTDWPGNNIKYWRERSPSGKFRWLLYDTDFGFAIYNDNEAYHATLNFVTSTNGPGWPNPPWSTEHIRMLLENPIFRSRFIQTMSTAINTTFEPSRVIARINEFQARIASEMSTHKGRWGGTISDWNNQVTRMRNFATNRHAYMRQHLASFFSLSQTVNINTEVKAGEGKFKVNGVVSNAKAVQPYFKDLPITVEPIAGLGYAFKEWKIKKRQSTPVSIIPAGSVWKYFDQGSRPVDWNTENFDDTAWPQGAEQLGYGENDEQTTVGYGGNSSNKFITTYFRKSFTVTDTVGFTALTGSMMIDDGAVVYLNGVEMHRYNMPLTAITNSTVALQASAENVYTPFTIPKGVVKIGNNVLAVEVHQNSAQSTDLSFALSLSTVRHGNTIELTSSVPLRMDTAKTDMTYEAYFEPVGNIITGIVINEINTMPSDLRDGAGEAEDWIELYNKGTSAVNLAGLYITDNLMNKTKYTLPAGDNMVIQPGAYKILWADEDVHQGSDHLPFKLSSNGEAVGLYQPLGENINILDEAVFTHQAKSGSFSRLPNGTGPFIFQSSGTPGSMNEIITSAAEGPLTVRIYPNPVTDYLSIESVTPLQSVELIDYVGRPLQHFTQVTSQSIEMYNYPSGMYILRLRSGNQTKTFKIIKQ